MEIGHAISRDVGAWTYREYFRIVWRRTGGNLLVLPRRWNSFPP
jgi:hypothetical protein